MGASSCLRIIACSGGDDASEPNALENKSSGGDKRGWSFRKKSGRQRGITSVAVSENTTPASRTRETLESALLSSPSPDNNIVSEKQTLISVDDEKKKSQLPVAFVAEPVDVDKATEVPVLVESKGTETEEDVLIGTELQSNLEVANAVDASKVEPDDVIITRKEKDEQVDDSVIIIIQAAIRGFLARRELLRRKKVVKLQAAVRGHLVRNQAMGSLRCVQAIVKMQTLVRARRSTKDGSRVSAVSAETTAAAQKLLENKFAKHLMESTPKTKPISIKCDPTKPSSAWSWLERWMSVSKPPKADLEREEKQLEETNNVKVASQVDSVKNSDSTLETEAETGFSSKVVGHHVELSETEAAEIDHDLIQSHLHAAKDTDSLLKEDEYVDEQPKYSLKRKASNPSFIAAQSKFEELTSSAGSNKATTLSSKEGKTNIDSSEADTSNTKKNSSLEEVAPAELSGSECGTELSVTSSLDSLDKKSDVEGADSKVEAKLLENGTPKTDQAELIEIDVKSKTPSVTVENSMERVENGKDEVEVLVTQHTPDSRKRRAEDESRPEEAATPMTITESQATPASQASSSVKAIREKSGKSGSSQKRKVSKKIASSPKQVTGTTEGNDNTEQKSGRRNSFGYDQEARESSGEKNSVPRFMQPTQSAKAKVQEHNSPRSSPDVQEREVSLKKRHSLPVAANGKQGTSPRIQLSASQAKPGAKDRKWQR